MSEDCKDHKEETKITTVEKVKDPKKVEAGKKLAAISKQAKEKKAAERLEKADALKEEEWKDPVVGLTVVGFIGLAMYFTYNKYADTGKHEQSERHSEDVSNAPKEVPKENATTKPKRVYRELDTLG